MPRTSVNMNRESAPIENFHKKRNETMHELKDIRDYFIKMKQSQEVASERAVTVLRSIIRLADEMIDESEAQKKDRMEKREKEKYG